MKIIIFFFVFTHIIHYKLKNSVNLLQKFIAGFISFFYFIEYCFLFFFDNYYYLLLLLLKYRIRENLIKEKKLKSIYVINEYKIKKNAKKKNINYIDQILKIYYYRRMYLGFTVVYIQIFLRKVKELKNYILFFYFYNFIKFYESLKKKIINYSLLFFFSRNINLIIYLEKKKLKFFFFYLLLKFNLIFIKLNFNNKVIFFCNSLKEKKK